MDYAVAITLLSTGILGQAASTPTPIVSPVPTNQAAGGQPTIDPFITASAGARSATEDESLKNEVGALETRFATLKQSFDTLRGELKAIGDQLSEIDRVLSTSATATRRSVLDEMHKTVTTLEFPVNRRLQAFAGVASQARESLGVSDVLDEMLFNLVGSRTSLLVRLTALRGSFAALQADAEQLDKALLGSPQGAVQRRAQSVKGQAVQQIATLDGLLANASTPQNDKRTWAGINRYLNLAKSLLDQDRVASHELLTLRTVLGAIVTDIGNLTRDFEQDLKDANTGLAPLATEFAEYAKVEVEKLSDAEAEHFFNTLKGTGTNDSADERLTTTFLKVKKYAAFDPQFAVIDTQMLKERLANYDTSAGQAANTLAVALLKQAITWLDTLRMDVSSRATNPKPEQQSIKNLEDDILPILTVSDNNMTVNITTVELFKQHKSAMFSKLRAAKAALDVIRSGSTAPVTNGLADLQLRIVGIAPVARLIGDQPLVYLQSYLSDPLLRAPAVKAIVVLGARAQGIIENLFKATELNNAEKQLTLKALIDIEGDALDVLTEIAKERSNPQDFRQAALKAILVLADGARAAGNPAVIDLVANKLLELHQVANNNSTDQFEQELGIAVDRGLTVLFGPKPTP